MLVLVLVVAAAVAVSVVVATRRDNGACNRFQKSSRRCTSCSHPNALDGTNLRIRTRYQIQARMSFSRKLAEPTLYERTLRGRTTTTILPSLLSVYFFTISFINAHARAPVYLLAHSRGVRKLAESERERERAKRRFRSERNERRLKRHSERLRSAPARVHR